MAVRECFGNWFFLYKTDISGGTPRYRVLNHAQERILRSRHGPCQQMPVKVNRRQLGKSGVTQF